MNERPPVIAVCGAARAAPELEAPAEAVGRLLAEAGAILACGGLGGVMTFAARGAARAGGMTIGVLPGRVASEANPWITLPLPTGMGEARNVLLVRFADAVIAIDGEWGTLSEIAMARKLGRPVVLLHPSPAAAGLGLEIAATPEAAVLAALGAARAGRRP